jgi:iron complex outermembrane receptor protein
MIISRKIRLRLLAGLLLSAFLAGGIFTPPLPAAEKTPSADEELLGVEQDVGAGALKDRTEKKLSEVFAGPEKSEATGAKHAQRQTESPSTITVLDQDDIKAYGVSTLEELLRIVPGVSVKDFNPVIKVLGIRGFQANMGNTVLLIIDGQEMNINLFGGVIWTALPIALDDIERIEVIRGPGSALYGAGALSGVINVTTKAPRDLKTATVIAEAGAYGGKDLGTILLKTKLAGEKAPFSFLASADFDKRQGWADPDRTMAKFLRTRAKAVYEPSGDVQASAEAGYMRGNLIYFINIAELDMKDNWILYANTSARWKGLRFIGYYRRFNLSAETLACWPPLQAILPTMSGKMDNFEGRLEYSHSFTLKDRLTAGAGYQMNIFDSSILASEYNDERRLGLFLQEEYQPWEKLLLTAGVRFDSRTAAPRLNASPGSNSITELSWSPRASALYTYNRDHNFRFAYGRAYRKPSFFEYGMKLKAMGEMEYFYNFDLKSAKVDTWEVGYRGRYFRRLQAELTWYYSRYRDAIIQSYSGTYQFQNYHNYADGTGVEFSLEAYLLSRLDGFFNYSYLKTISRLGKEEPSALGEDFYPEHFLNLGARSKPFPGFQASASFSLVTSNRETVMDPNRSMLMMMETAPMKLGPHFLLNLHASYQVIPQVEVGLKFYLPLKGNDYEHAGITWNRSADQGGPVNWGGEAIGRTISGYVEASF